MRIDLHLEVLQNQLKIKKEKRQSVIDIKNNFNSNTVISPPVYFARSKHKSFLLVYMLKGIVETALIATSV